MKKIFALMSVIFLLSSTGGLQAQSWWKGRIRGEGPKVTRELDLASFEKVQLAISGNVYIREGSAQRVTIEAQENIIDNLLTEVSDDTWKIRFDRMVSRHDGVTITITLPRLRGASISGSGNIRGESAFKVNGDFSSNISGSGNIQLEISADNVNSRISGSGNIKLRGEASSINVEISGSGNVDAQDLRCARANVRISGSGDCTVDAADDLEARVSGSGDIIYTGRPRVNARVSGSGKVKGKG